MRSGDDGFLLMVLFLFFKNPEKKGTFSPGIKGQILKPLWCLCVHVPVYK